MLQIHLVGEPTESLPADARGQIVSSVGFTGTANGVIHLYTGLSLARVITSRMLGLGEAEIEGDGMVNDAMGELSNIVVGNVKSRLCDQGWPCTLTIPSIVRGQQLSIEAVTDTARRVLGFKNSEHHLLAELMVQELQRKHRGAPRSTKILTVDDSKSVRIIVARAFKPFDCVVLEASNGAEGLEVAAREKPDLILLDYTMPVMDGLETVTKLREDPDLKTTPVIMLTAEASREVITKMASLGVRDYLVKPFKEPILLEQVGRVVPLGVSGDH